MNHISKFSIKAGPSSASPLPSCLQMERLRLGAAPSVAQDPTARQVWICAPAPVGLESALVTTPTTALHSKTGCPKLAALRPRPVQARQPEPALSSAPLATLPARVPSPATLPCASDLTATRGHGRVSTAQGTSRLSLLAKLPWRPQRTRLDMTLSVTGSDGPSPRAAPGPARPQTCTRILWRGGGPPVPAAPSPAHSPHSSAASALSSCRRWRGVHDCHLAASRPFRVGFILALSTLCTVHHGSGPFLPFRPHIVSYFRFFGT